jgi:tetratricopeptide (TPR) repeat protein
MSSRQAEDLLRQGQSLWKQGQLAEAATLAQAAQQKGLHTPAVFALLGDCYRGLQQHAQALPAYAQAWEQAPDNLYFRFLCAESLFHLGRFAETVELLADLDPGDDLELATERAIKLGRAQQQLGLVADAEMNLLQAFIAAAEHENAACNLVAFYELEGMAQASRQILEAALPRHPGSARLHYNLGTQLSESGETARAIAMLTKTLEIAPGHTGAHQNLALSYLRSGHTALGWQHYAWRPSGKLAYAKTATHWTPAVDRLAQSLAGENILLQGEQGLGDELFFLRFLPALKARGACITYRPCNSKLVPFLQQFQQQGLLDHVLAWDAPLQDEAAPLLVGDLALALSATEPDNYPPSLQLQVDPAALSRWQAQHALLSRSRPRLGLTWRAGSAAPRHTQARGTRWLHKEVPLADLLDLISPLAVDVVVLQRDPEPDDMAYLHSRIDSQRILDASGCDQDLPELLALLSLLDGLVGVSNTNVHLMASLGKGGDILVPSPAEFRWQETGSTSPWFPGFRVWRQHADGHWAAALAGLQIDWQLRYPTAAAEADPTNVQTDGSPNWN